MCNPGTRIAVPSAISAAMMTTNVAASFHSVEPRLKSSVRNEVGAQTATSAALEHGFDAFTTTIRSYPGIAATQPAVATHVVWSKLLRFPACAVALLPVDC